MLHIKETILEKVEELVNRKVKLIMREVGSELSSSKEYLIPI